MSQPNVAYTHSNFIQKLKLKPSSSSSYPAPSSKPSYSSCFAMAALFETVLVSQAAEEEEDSIGTTSVEVSMATSILVIVLSMGIFSMAVSAALQVSRALYNYFTRTVNRTVLLEEETNAIKILSYNVMFKNHMLNKRMEALGEIILCHLPDVICFQEVSLEIYSIFEQSEWWNKYSCSVLHETVKSEPFFCIQLSKLPVNSIGFIPFTNFGPRKKISMLEIEVCRGKPLVVATSHLKSPIPGDDQMFSKKRTAQAKAALNLLKNYPNVIFGGDMNWDEDLDGRFPLLDGWVDAWIELRPRESGWTYDTKSNPMSRSPINNPLQKRLDRFICNLQDFELKKIDMIGTVPSDHYGLLLEVQSKY
ncbi:tyrosyl-DNA phosphodiesterase 2-like isoform X1 [Camellia sinensis]|uniref:tyrosyl-DNA phosphodiesterase 2-like isoform X1 n=2 Tax=Camellia sinensis TaxID=4442 RepID=UPI001036A915|nr:tyrosyl-DNA phosphodiesterase 2-like isoform X1 [Camellia sinensis]